MAAHTPAGVPGAARRPIHDTLRAALDGLGLAERVDEYDFVVGDTLLADLCPASELARLFAIDVERKMYLDADGIAIEGMRAVRDNNPARLKLTYARVGVHARRDQWETVTMAARERLDDLVRMKHAQLLVALESTRIVSDLELQGPLGLALRNPVILQRLDSAARSAASLQEPLAATLNMALRLLPDFLREHDWPLVDWLYERGVVARFDQLEALVKDLNDPLVTGYFQRKLAQERNDDARLLLAAAVDAAS
jgi:hypothetical protein